MRSPVPRNFEGLVRKIDYFKVNDIRVERVEGSRADVWVDVIGKNRDSRAQHHYKGTVELDTTSGRWLITSMKNLREVR